MNRSRSLVLFLFLTLFLASVSAKDEDSKGGSSVGLKLLIAALVISAVAGLGVFLFKIWQRKKREEQHARLLKLFEDDDELEVELGIRD